MESMKTATICRNAFLVTKLFTEKFSGFGALVDQLQEKSKTGHYQQEEKEEVEWSVVVDRLNADSNCIGANITEREIQIAT